MSAAIYNTSMGIGTLLAPLFASIMNEALGFRMTMDIAACFDLVFAFAYLFFGTGLSAFA